MKIAAPYCLSIAVGVLIGVTLLMVVLLYGFFRYTRLGLAMRASAENPASARGLPARIASAAR